MSSVVLMKILESAPDRYDRGMAWLTLGGAARAQARVAELAVVHAGARVLEIGCGTGALTEKLVDAGAEVEAIDHSPEMLDRARARFAARSACDRNHDRPPLLRESTAAELDGLDDASFDSVTASLALSEMSPRERAYVLRHAARLLRPDGRIVVSDEVRPSKLWQRALHLLVRLPMALLTWVVTGTTTSAIGDLAGELRATGLEPFYEQRSPMGTLAVIAARRAA